MDKTIDINSLRKTFEELGCISEKVIDEYFSMEIPALVDYKSIKQQLDKLEQCETIGYAEPCLAAQHRTDKK